MRKNILTKYLPFVAAVLLATSCGKDDNGGSIVNQPSSTEEVVQPDPNPDPAPEAPKTVTIPFSVKVNDGASLSKILYEEKDGKNGKVVSRTFEPEDCVNITLDLSSTPGVASTSDPLELSQDGEGGYVFSGEVTVESEYADAFTNDEMQLTGTFEYSGKTDNAGYSTTSLVDLEENHCDHTYKAEFKSCDEEISFVDQNAYLCFTVAAIQTEFTLSFNGEETVRIFVPNAETHKIWIAVPCGGDGKPTVKGALISDDGMDLKPGTVYKVDRHDKYEVLFVDLGTNDGKLWATCNLGATTPWEFGDYYAWGETTTKNDYSWSTYAYGRAKEGEETHAMVNKYCPSTESDYWYSVGETATNPDNKKVLDPDDDIAHVTNSNWSMPTKSDFDNLKNSCYWVWTEDYNDSGVKGYIVYKAKDGDGGKTTLKNQTIKDGYAVATTPHIFLPAAGRRNGTTLYSDGYYWSSSLITSSALNARCVHLNSGIPASNSSTNRCSGLSVRPVRSMNPLDVESYDNAMFEPEKENKL